MCSHSVSDRGREAQLKPDTLGQDQPTEREGYTPASNTTACSSETLLFPFTLQISNCNIFDASLTVSLGPKFSQAPLKFLPN